MWPIYNTAKGFTLVEIMVVVVIIGLLGSMAVPVYQKVRKGSLETSVLNDARLYGAAIQQYCAEYGVTQAPTMDYDSSTGNLSGDANFLGFIRQIGKHYTANLSTPGVDNSVNAFQLQLVGAFDGVAATFSGEGKKTN